jgi:DDE superfamily endonuclease
MIPENSETTAAVSLQEFLLICKDIDREIESEFSGSFAQRRTWEKAKAYIQALSCPQIAVKSTWDAAEYSGYDNPGPLQSLIGENKWRPEDIWDRVVVKAGKLAGKSGWAGDLGIGVIFDETADVKRGKMTCGVGYQYAGCAGGVVNCVTWVMASLVRAGFKTWASAELFLPEKDWFTGRGETGTARRKQAGIPNGTRFMSKPKLALKQLRKIRELGTEISYGSGDEVYGRYDELRADHEENGEAYAYFVPRNFFVETAGGERRRVDELLELSAAAFEERSAGSGEKGPRYYDWAMIGLKSENHFLLLRRPVREETAERGDAAAAGLASTTGKGGGNELAGQQEGGTGMRQADRVKDEGITFCLCYVPPGSRIMPTISNLIFMTGARWGVEETMATGKGPLGWDENQFRKYDSMRRHTALAGVAMLRASMIKQRLDEICAGTAEIPAPCPEDEEAGSVITASAGRAQDVEITGEDLSIPIGDSLVPASADQVIPADIGFIRLSVNEILRLSAIANSGISDAGKAFHLGWSKWRRMHQAISRWYHRIARMKAAQNSRRESSADDPVTASDRNCGHPLRTQLAGMSLKVA